MPKEVGGASKVATLIRGVDQAHPAYDDALKGLVQPRGGTAGHLNANAHSAGRTANSNLSSWTTNANVARDFATNDSGIGVILTKTVPPSNRIKPSVPFLPSEKEVLLQRVIKGAGVKHVK